MGIISGRASTVDSLGGVDEIGSESKWIYFKGFLKSESSRSVNLSLEQKNQWNQAGDQKFDF